MNKSIVFLCILLSATLRTQAQPTLPIPTNLTHAYQAGTRSTTGRPGKAYWQNRADYNIEITFDPTTRELQGTVTIDYTNNSLDTLKRLLFKLYPNLYQQQAIRSVT